MKGERMRGGSRGQVGGALDQRGRNKRWRGEGRIRKDVKV